MLRLTSTFAYLLLANVPRRRAHLAVGCAGNDRDARGSAPPAARGSDSVEERSHERNDHDEHVGRITLLLRAPTELFRWARLSES